MRFKRGELSIDFETLAYWGIAAVVAGIVILGYAILKGKVDISGFLRNFFRG